jgi:hypothetical protein
MSETWTVQTIDASSGDVVADTGPETFTRTYTVEFVSGGWIATASDVAQ